MGPIFFKLSLPFHRANFIHLIAPWPTTRMYASGNTWGITRIPRYLDRFDHLLEVTERD